jgi:hypothetical protein
MIKLHSVAKTKNKKNLIDYQTDHFSFGVNELEMLH